MWIRRLISRLKYGAPVILVSGLPRSGTSMMMKMLDAGGLEIVTDNVRTADEDNPKGYYELERVKDLDKKKDKSWLGELKGKVVKIIAYLLKDLPHDCNYKVVFMRRDIGEILASQNKMLVRRGEVPDEVSDERMAKLYETHLRKVKYITENRPNFDVLEVEYRDAMEDPKALVQTLNRFLGNRLDTSKMVGVVDKSLYRNRQESTV